MLCLPPSSSLGLGGDEAEGGERGTVRGGCSNMLRVRSKDTSAKISGRAYSPNPLTLPPYTLYVLRTQYTHRHHRTGLLVSVDRSETA